MIASHDETTDFGCGQTAKGGVLGRGVRAIRRLPLGDEEAFELGVWDMAEAFELRAEDDLPKVLLLGMLLVV